MSLHFRQICSQRWRRLYHGQTHCVGDSYSHWVNFEVFFFFNFCGDKSPFCGATGTLCFGLGLTPPWVLKSGWMHYCLSSLLHVHNGSSKSTLARQGPKSRTTDVERTCCTFGHWVNYFNQLDDTDVH